MSSSSRRKETNALQKYLSRKISLHGFLMTIERVLATQKEEEHQKGHHMPKESPNWHYIQWRSNQLKPTRCILLFQEHQSRLLHNIVLVEDEQTIYKEKFHGQDRNKKCVHFRESNHVVSCSCFMFEFNNIPCRHMLECQFKIVNSHDDFRGLA